MAETVRTLERRIGLPPEKAAYLVRELRSHFADAWVTGHELLIDRMTNDPKDRHVVAAAVKCGAQAIVTYNLRHFPVSSVEPWGIEVQAPSTFLRSQYDQSPSVVIDKLHAQARNLGRTLPQQLAVC